VGRCPAARLGPWVFGCDDCQTVCPWNAAVAPSSDPELLPRRRSLDLDALLRLTLAEYQATFWGTALARARYDGLVRNALLAAGASGERRYREAVAAWCRSEHPGIREAAGWALGRLGGQPGKDGGQAT
jgi:epoxyqueuosine reductase